MEEQTMSPTPGIEVKDAEIINEKPTMDFSEAIANVVLKKKITKLEWKNENIYGFLEKEILCLHKDDGKTYQWILSEADLDGKDYIVL